MPLVLAGPVVSTIPLNQEDEALSGARVTSFRFDLLGRRFNDDGSVIREAFVGELRSVVDGSLDWTYNTAIKGGGSIGVLDVGQKIDGKAIDWLNVRIRPVAMVARADRPETLEEFPLGVFLPAAPVEDWTDRGRSWKVELLDKCSILDQDVITDSETGAPVTYSLPSGTNVIASVISIIEGSGESAQAIEPDGKVLANPMTWDVGTSRLKIINDLLDAANYFSLWVDGSGQFRASKYVPPESRPPTYAMLAPFDDTGASLMTPNWTRDRDIYSVPNRVVVVGQGDAETPALVSVATNEDPASEFSYPARGRWITLVETGVEAVDQAALDAYAYRKLASATSVTSGITAEHPILPDLRVNSVVEFRNTRADVSILCAVTKTSITFDPTALVKSELREATGLDRDASEES